MNNPTGKQHYGVIVEEEHGYLWALYGLSKSYRKSDKFSFSSFEQNDALVTQMKKASLNLAGRGEGHDKFLRQLTVSLEINCSRRFMQQYATYIFAVTQSSSTMHSLKKSDIKKTDFIFPDKKCSWIARALFWINLKGLPLIIKYGNPQSELGAALMESYLQDRATTTNYANIDNMLKQRWNHSINTNGHEEWKIICLSLYNQLEHKELLSVELVDGKLQRKDRK